MEDHTTSALVYWVPMIILIVIWVFFISRMGGYPKYLREMNDRFGRQNEEVISLLRDIKTILENRKA